LKTNATKVEVISRPQNSYFADAEGKFTIGINVNDSGFVAKNHEIKEIKFR
jgi:hypothetical protein